MLVDPKKTRTSVARYHWHFDYSWTHILRLHALIFFFVKPVCFIVFLSVLFFSVVQLETHFSCTRISLHCKVEFLLINCMQHSSWHLLTLIFKQYMQSKLHKQTTTFSLTHFFYLLIFFILSPFLSFRVLFVHSNKLLSFRIGHNLELDYALFS